MLASYLFLALGIALLWLSCIGVHYVWIMPWWLAVPVSTVILFVPTMFLIATYKTWGKIDEV